MTWTTEAVVHYGRNSPVGLKKTVIPMDANGQLGPNNVLVRTEYASINPVDVKLQALSLFKGEKHTLKDFAGTVEAVGRDVASKYTVGQKVWGSVHRPGPQHFVGSLTIVDPAVDVLEPLPAKLTTEQASSIGVVYGTAFQMLESAQAYGHTLGPASRVLVLGGATSVGTYVVQLAKKFYQVGTVVATSSGHSADYARSFGADDTIDYTRGDLSGQLRAYVAKQGYKFDAILDCVGGYDAVAVYPEILKPANTGSAYITVMGDGGPAATYAGTMASALISLPRSLFRQVFGKYLGINYKLLLLSHDGVWTARANEFFAMPGVRVPIDSVYPVGDLKKAWAKVDSTRARGKVVVQF